MLNHVIVIDIIFEIFFFEFAKSFVSIRLNELIIAILCFFENDIFNKLIINENMCDETLNVN